MGGHTATGLTKKTSAERKAIAPSARRARQDPTIPLPYTGKPIAFPGMTARDMKIFNGLANNEDKASVAAMTAQEQKEYIALMKEEEAALWDKETTDARQQVDAAKSELQKAEDHYGVVKEDKGTKNAVNEKLARDAKAKTLADVEAKSQKIKTAIAKKREFAAKMEQERAAAAPSSVPQLNPPLTPGAFHAVINAQGSTPEAAVINKAIDAMFQMTITDPETGETATLIDPNTGTLDKYVQILMRSRNQPKNWPHEQNKEIGKDLQALSWPTTIKNGNGATVGPIGRSVSDINYAHQALIKKDLSYQGKYGDMAKPDPQNSDQAQQIHAYLKNNPPVSIRKLTANGSDINDWRKLAITLYKENGIPYELHFHYNIKTGQVNPGIDFKVKAQTANSPFVHFDNFVSVDSNRIFV